MVDRKETDTKKEAARQPRQVAESAAEMTRKAAGTAEEVAERQAERMEEGTHRIERLGAQGGEAVRRTTEVAAGVIESAGDRLASGATAGADALARSGAALARGLQDASRIWVELAQDTMMHGIEATETLLRCRTMGDVFQVQSTYMRSSLDAFLDKSARISDLSARIIAETTGPMSFMAGRAGAERGEGQSRRRAT